MKGFPLIPFHIRKHAWTHVHRHRIQHMHARVERVRDLIHPHWMVDVLQYECAQKQDTLIGPVKRAVAQRREAIVPQAVAGGGVGDFMPDGEKVERKKVSC